MILLNLAKYQQIFPLLLQNNPLTIRQRDILNYNPHQLESEGVVVLV